MDGTPNEILPQKAQRNAEVHVCKVGQFSLRPSASSAVKKAVLHAHFFDTHPDQAGLATRNNNA